MKTPIKTTSRRRFGKVLAALTAAAGPAATAQQKQAEAATEEQLPSPCSVNSGLAEYDIPRDTEPSFTFRA